jgi:fructose-1,6-bisphosphatase/inositol monophosphatase family enzyme
MSHDLLRQKLCALQDHVLASILLARKSSTIESMSSVAATTAADTIYHIDKVSEEAILHWFAHHWPQDEPVQLVMEGIEDDEAVTFPSGTPLHLTRWKCILDPIDGTRNIMYDKRSAWILAGLAPQRGPATNLSDILIAAMTEIPTSKAWRSDQLSAVRGQGLQAEGVNVLQDSREPLTLRPSQARNFSHGFASIANFFPEGKALLAAFEEDLWTQLDEAKNGSPLVFTDQYITTGGQIYELMVGHDRLIGDLRPLAHRTLGLHSSLVCHPYDICTALLFQELGGIIEQPDGSPLQAPLDTTSPVAFMAYANAELADKVRPLLPALFQKHFP